MLASQPRRPAPVARSEPTRASVEELERTMAGLRAEAKVRAAVVQRLVVAERRRERTHRAAAPDPLVAVRREQDRAAYLLIYEADRLARQDGERKRAVDEYRRVLALFPETHWASVARERLVAMGASSRRYHGPGLPAVGIVGEGEDMS